MPEEIKEYDVHLYATVRVKICGVRATSQVEAIKACDNINLHDLISVETLNEAGGVEALDGRSHAVEGEYAEEILSVTVDECGDDQYENTRSYVRVHDDRWVPQR